MVYRQLTKALEDMDVKPIEALGKEFNPGYITMRLCMLMTRRPAII